MRNLYKRLGIPTSSSLETINQAIIRCRDRSLKQDAEAVLLNPRAKKLYDQTQHCLESLATLRNGLGLSHAPNWNAPLDSEFNSGASNPLRGTQVINHKSSGGYQSAQTTRTRETSNTRTPKRNTSAAPSGHSFNSSGVWFVVVIVIIGLIIWSSSNESAPSTYRPSKPAASPSPVVQFSHPPVAAPAHGAMRSYTSAPAVAPLGIETSYGGYYFVKLEDPTTKRTVLELFVHGGRTVEVNVPLGTYIMKYASGDQWYGREHFFGPQTAYSKAESLFYFTEDARGYSGYTVTLYKVAHGNLETERIAPEQF